jgi:exodeoxyribonuclease V alpha subunit
MASTLADAGGETIVRHLAEEAAFIGIGYATAGRLWRRYGADLYRLLGDGDVAALSEVLGEDRAEELARAWRERLAEGDVVVWLAEHGFDRRLARRILALWGADAPARLKGNPYLLMALAEWGPVDAAAARIGVDRRSPIRLVAAVEAALYSRYREGHTWIAAGKLRSLVSKLLNGDLATADRAIALAVDDGAAFSALEGFQAAGAHMMERYAAERVRDMLAGPAIGDLVARDVDDDCLSAWLAGFCRDTGLELDPEQREAVRIGVQERYGLVVGGAGVGKTTVLKALCDASWRLQGERQFV